MNNEAYTSFPDESETLLVEGCEVDILAIEDVVIENQHASFTNFTGKPITIVHLYNNI